jgi:hypothetical protein
VTTEVVGDGEFYRLDLNLPTPPRYWPKTRT